MKKVLSTTLTLISCFCTLTIYSMGDDVSGKFSLQKEEGTAFTGELQKPVTLPKAKTFQLTITNNSDKELSLQGVYSRSFPGRKTTSVPQTIPAHPAHSNKIIKTVELSKAGGALGTLEKVYISYKGSTVVTITKTTSNNWEPQTIVIEQKDIKPEAVFPEIHPLLIGSRKQ